MVPIKGIVPRQVLSGIGAPRDGGARDHHGIDIFVPRGTPVLASVDGVVRIDETPRGGRVVWLRDSRTRRNIYYAHLNDWAVASGAEVRAGDVIGYVGNTGNARTTPPHLHFGVYDRGPGDPVPYLARNDPAPSPPIAGSQDHLGRWMRVSASSAALADVLGSVVATAPVTLARGSVVRTLAAFGSRYRVELPDGRLGSMRAADLLPAESSRETAAFAGEVRAAPHDVAPVVDVVNTPREVAVLGRFGGFALIRIGAGSLGWAALGHLILN
jgi:hypothetical protein